MEAIRQFIESNSTLLFDHISSDELQVIFDEKGFFFTEETQGIYNRIKSIPHIYVAYSECKEGYFYVGKSFQQGGRWKRQHAYHLGTLAYHLLNTIRYDDQNHKHWIDKWMDQSTFQILNNNYHLISLRYRVKIAFIPFVKYAHLNHLELSKEEIRKINTQTERILINSYNNDNLVMLNVK